MNGTISNFTIGVLGTLEEESNGFVGHYPNVLAALILFAFLGFMMLGAKVRNGPKFFSWIIWSQRDCQGVSNDMYTKSTLFTGDLVVE